MKEPLLKAGAHWPLAFNSSGGGIARLFLTVMLMVVSLCAAAQSPSAYVTTFESDGDIGLQSATEFVMPNGGKDRIRLSNAATNSAWVPDKDFRYFSVNIGSTAKFSIPRGYVVEKIEFYAANKDLNSTAYTAGMNSTLTVSGGSNGNYTLTNPDRKTEIEFSPTKWQSANTVYIQSLKFTLKRVSSEWWRGGLGDISLGRGSVNVNFPSLPNYDDNGDYKWNGYTETVADQSVVSMTRNGENTGNRTITRVNPRNGSTTITINYPGNIRYDAFTASFNVTLIDLVPVNTIDADHYTAVPMDEGGKPITDALQTEKVYWHITAKPGRTLATDALVVTDYNQTPQNVVTMNCANDGVVEINNIEDWNTFATYATGQNARLCANLNVTDLGSRPGNRPYSGTFDGQNHTLTLNYSYKDGRTGDVAPFRYISNATIKNLNVTGNISSNAPNNDAASIVGEANGTCVIENCYSTVAINWSFSTQSDCNNAGMVGRVNNNSNITFNNCAFVGSFTADGRRFGGFVGFIEERSRLPLTTALWRPM